MCLYFLHHILWPEVSVTSDDDHVHATAQCSVCVFAYACPTCSILTACEELNRELLAILAMQL